MEQTAAIESERRDADAHPKVWQRVSLLAAAVLILWLAGAARFHLLGAQSLWNDEGSAYVQATRTLSEIASNAARDIHPPGYYSLLALWRIVTGESEFALRALSAFASLITVALTFALGRRLYGPAAGIAAALLVALNTFSIYYAQEARMYALLALWAAASMACFVGLMRTPADASHHVRLRWALGLALTTAAGLYTHYAYPAVIAAQALLFLLRVAADLREPLTGARRPHLPAYILPFIAANTLALLFYLPWLPTALNQITTWPNTGAPIPLDEALATIVGWFAFGITYQSGDGSVAVAFFLLFGLLAFPRIDGRRTWWRMLVPVAWVLVTLGGFLALELFRPANLKFLLPAQIGFALWMGRGVWVLWTLRPRRTAPVFQQVPKLAAVVGTVGLLAVLWSGITPLYTDPAFQRDDYRALVQTINASPSEGSAVILNAPGQSEVFGYYYGPDREDVYLLPIGLTVDRSATLAEVRGIIDSYERVYAVLWGTDERDPERLVEGTLATEAYEVDSQWYGSVRLVRYVTPADLNPPVEAGARFGESIRLERYALSAETVAPGDVLQLEFEWTTAAAFDRRYKVFVQLLDASGMLAAQRDSEPAGAQQPTLDWTPGETIADRHALLIPATLPPGDYTLIAGLYDANDPNARLPLDSGGDYLNLGTVRVRNAE